MISRLDDFKCLVVTGGNKRAAGLTLVEKVLLGHFLGLGVVGNEDDFDRPIPRYDKLAEKEKEAPGEIFFHRVHGPGSVHDGNNDRVRLRFCVGDHVLVGKVALVERKTLLNI